MSIEVIRSILDRISAEAEFRTRIIYWPEGALADYALTPEEAACFKARKFDNLDIPAEVKAALANLLDTSGF